MGWVSVSVTGAAAIACILVAVGARGRVDIRDDMGLSIFVFPTRTSCCHRLFKRHLPYALYTPGTRFHVFHHARTCF